MNDEEDYSEPKSNFMDTLAQRLNWIKKQF
jgi:hypothetical protein